MVQRINFIEKGAYALTYRNMLIFAGGATLLCIFIYGLFCANYVIQGKRLASMKRQIQELNFQKEKALAAMQIAQTQQTSMSATPLASLFVKMPMWSTVLSDMVSRVPKQIWFDQIKTSSDGEQIEKNKKIEITGKSASHAAIAQYVNSLEDSEWFENTVLVNSKKENNGYSFVINSEVKFPTAEW